MTEKAFGVNWKGWHSYCHCEHRQTFTSATMIMPREFGYEIAKLVQRNDLPTAEKLITEWVRENVDQEATWEWGKKMNVGNPRMTFNKNNFGCHRDIIDVKAPWCTDAVRCLMPKPNEEMQ
jgi:hypothetical protein